MPQSVAMVRASASGRGGGKVFEARRAASAAARIRAGCGNQCLKTRKNKQAARERIARLRAEQARRRRRRIWLGGSAAVAVVIAVAVAISLAVTGSSGAAGEAPSRLSLAPLSTLGALQPAPAPGATGPENVPVPAIAPPADTATVATGQPIDQISCQTGEQTLFHIHAHLAIFVNGKARQVSAAIGSPLIAPQPVTFPTGL